MAPPTADSRGIKAEQAANFDALNRVVEGTPFDRHLRFLNFGYSPLDGEAEAGPGLGRLFPNRESAQLLFQTIGDTPVAGQRVVEVGCGRAGNVWLLQRYLAAGLAVGLDLARSSLVAGQPSLEAGAALVHGDAERLPFAAASIDVAVSIETSCTYPDLDRFLREVARITAVGGWFCWSDLLDSRLAEPVLRALAPAGFRVEADRDITPNVLASRQRRARRQQVAFERAPQSDAGAIEEWLGAEGSILATELESGQRRYRLIRARRLDQPCAPSLLTDDERQLARAGAEETARLLTLTTAAAPAGPT